MPKSWIICPCSARTERQQVVYEWNDTEREYPRDKCVHELFEEQVRRSPKATAVVFEEEELSYGELNARANRLAHYLRELGVKPDERVAICVERGFEMIVGLLAILKAGGGYVPLDPAYPEERLQYMLEDSAPVVLLTQSHLEDRFCGMGDGVPVLDLNATAAWQSFSESNPDADAVGLISSHLAYVMAVAGVGGGAGDPRRSAGGAQSGDGGRVAGRAEGGRGLCAAGSRIIPRSGLKLHAGRQRAGQGVVDAEARCEFSVASLSVVR